MTEITLAELQKINSIDRLIEIHDWCEQMFGPYKSDSRRRWTGGRWWLDGSYSFKFTHSEDALLFKLKWA